MSKSAAGLKPLKVIPLGGLGEFGMNMLVLQYGDDILVVDAGMMFPDSELLGVDLVIPRKQTCWIRRNYLRWCRDGWWSWVHLKWILFR